MNKGPFWLRRLGRRLCWGRPTLYRCFGLVRGRGDCFDEDFDLWLGGFPRSANTFAAEAFQWANPGVRVASHRHLPPFLIHWLDIARPGIFLIREPEDAVISWAILWGGHLEESLNYYIDFHQALLPYLDRLFVAPFEVVTRDFGEVLEGFNQRFGTNYQSFEHAPESVKECFSRIERNSPLSGSELQVCRPSPERARLRPGFRRQLRETPALIRKLAIANELYAAFTTTALGKAFALQPADSKPRRASLPPPLPQPAYEPFYPAPLGVPALALCLDGGATPKTIEPTDPRVMLSYLAFRLKRYSLPVLFVGLALGLRLALEPALKGQVTFGFFLVAVVVTAWTSGTSETLLALVLGFLAAEWFIIPPVKSLVITGAPGWWGAGLYFFFGLAVVWFMKSKQSARLMALSSAVEARRRLEEVERHANRTEEIAQKLETLTAIIEASQYSLLSVNSDGVITTWNRAARDLFGYTPNEALGQPLALLVPPEGERRGQDILARVIRGHQSEPWEALLVRKGGARVPVWLTVSPLQDAGGKRLGMVLVARTGD